MMEVLRLMFKFFFYHITPYQLHIKEYLLTRLSVFMFVIFNPYNLFIATTHCFNFFEENETIGK